MIGLRKLSVLVLCLFFVSCTNKNDKSQQGSQQSSQKRGLASTKVSRLQIKLIKKRRAKKLAEIKKATQGFLIPEVYLRRLSKKDRASYYQLFAKAAADLEMIGRAKGKIAYNSYDVEQEIQELFFPKANAQANEVVCVNSAWVIKIKKNKCDSTTWSFYPSQEEDGISDYIPHIEMWEPSVARCARLRTSSGGAAFVCPMAGVEIVDDQVLLMCNRNPKGETGECLDEFNSPRNQFERLSELCRVGQDQSLPIVSNMNCAQFNQGKANYVQMYKDNCKGASGAVLNMCNAISKDVEGVQKSIVDATDPLPKDSLPPTSSCRALSGDQLQASEGISADWENFLQMSKSICKENASVNVASLANRYGTCDIDFPGQGLTPIRELTDDFSPNPGAIQLLNFAREYGFTPSQFQAILCKDSMDRKVTNPGVLKGRLQQRLGEYRLNSKLEIVKTVAAQQNYGKLKLNKYFEGNNRLLYGPMASWFSETFENVTNYWNRDGRTMEGGEAIMTGSSLYETHVNTFLDSISEQGEIPNSAQIEKLFKGFLARINQDAKNAGKPQPYPDRQTQEVLKLAMVHGLANKMAPPEFEQGLRDASQWFKDCSNQLGTIENAGQFSPKDGRPLDRIRSGAKCSSYKRVKGENVATYARKHIEGEPFVIVNQGTGECVQPFVIKEDGDMGKCNLGYNPTRAVLSDPNGEAADHVAYLIGIKPVGRQNCSGAKKLDLTSETTFPNSESAGFAIFELYDCEKPYILPEQGEETGPVDRPSIE